MRATHGQRLPAHANGSRAGTPANGTLALDSKKFLSQIRLTFVARHLGLSHREQEIVRGFFVQETETAAALRLGLSPHTVHTYVQRIHRKLGSADRCSAVIRVFATYLALTSLCADESE